MYCEQCGRANEDGSKFCEGCGAVLETENNVNNPGVQIENQYFNGQVATQNKMQPVNTYAAPAYVYNTAVAPKVKKPITVKQKIIMILIGIIVVAAVVFFGVCYTMSNPENTVKDFFNSTVAHDFSKSYDCLDITQGEFTTKDMFIKMMENKAKGMPKKEILNYNIKEVDANKALNGIYESASSPKSAYKNTSNTSSGLMKYYTVEYTEKGSSSAQTGSIILIKQKSKSWLFFDSYKVAAEGIV
ncbi:MAG: zinc ribbon domain-containing protein, partial [Clostridia bacterium]